jgi:hypothetical protein
MTPEEHNKTLGTLHLVYGGLHGLILLLMAGFFIFFAGFVLKSPGGAADGGVFMVIMTIVMLFSLAYTIPSFVAGYGLLKRKSWAKLWGIIAGVIAGMSFPLGTALCVYSIWFLLGEEGRKVYGEAQTGRMPEERERLYGAPAPAGWASQYAQGEREREYAPPPPPPNWRD